MSPTYQGDLWQIFVGDCLEILPQLPTESVALTVTSPPYYLQRGYYSALPNDIENEPTFEGYLGKLKQVMQELYRLTVPGGRVCFVIDDKHTSPKVTGENRNLGTHAYLITAGIEIGFIYKGLIIWQKLRSAHASGGARTMLGSFPYPPNIPIVEMFEFILVFQKRGKRQVPPTIKEQSKLTFDEFKWAATGVWEIPPERYPYGSCPAPYPVEIPYRLIKLFSFVGDTVLDPFMGSGTTLVVAKQLNRKAIGIEINPTFAAEARDRLQTLL